MKRLNLQYALALGSLVFLVAGAAWSANDSAGGYGEGTGGSSPLPIRTSTDGARRGHSEEVKTDDINMRGGKAASDKTTNTSESKTPGMEPKQRAEGKASNKGTGNATSAGQVKMRGGSMHRECKECPRGMANDCC